MTGEDGNPTAKLQTKTKGKQEVIKANVTTADVAHLKETFLPDRFKFDEAIRLALDLPIPEPEPEPEKPKPKKKHHKPPPIVLPPPPPPPQIVQPAPIDIDSPDPLEINLSFDIEEGEHLGPQEVEVNPFVPITQQRPPREKKIKQKKPKLAPPAPPSPRGPIDVPAPKNPDLKLEALKKLIVDERA